MREDLQRRISAAIDSAEGVDGDPGLRELLASDPDAAAYAHDAARLGRILREWPLPTPDDDAFEALARRIEQRLDDDAGLARIADPTAPPQFDDDDDLRDATAGLLGPVTSSGELELESIPPPVAGARSPAAVPPPRPAARPEIPKPAAMPGPSAARPPAPPPAREIPKLVPAAQQREERLSFPSLAPPPPALDLQLGAPAATSAARRERTRKGLGWVAGLAAAAAVGLGVVATTQMAEPDQLATMSPQGSSAAAPVAADLARPEAEEAEPALAAPAAPPGAAPASAAPLEVASLEPRDEAEGGRAQAARSDRGGIAAATPRPARAAPLASAFDDHEAAPRRRAAASGGPVASSATSTGAAAGGGAPSPAQRVAEPPPSPAAAAPRTRAAEVEPIPDEDLPEQPERGEVQAALQAVEPAVRACAQDEHGTAQVRIVVVGTSGRVTTATVSGQFAGTPVGSCIARAVRTARFPRFAADRFEITYPFQL